MTPSLTEGPSLDFFDCNIGFGRPMNRSTTAHQPPPATAAELLAELDRAGIREALVWHAAQRDIGPVDGNSVLADALRGAARLHGCWVFLPPQTRELGSVDDYFATAARAGIRAFRAFPNLHRYLFREEVIGALVARLERSGAPLLVRVDDIGWDPLYNLLAAFPRLTLILCNMGPWNNDRLFRPLLDRYPRVCVETSGHITDGGIEALVKDYGAGRLLFGSGFPDSYLGSMMLALARAEISEADKQAIAGDNLRRILNAVTLSA